MYINIYIYIYIYIYIFCLSDFCGKTFDDENNSKYAWI